MSTTDQALAQQIQYHLLEPPDGGQSWPSGLWARDEVFNIANQRQNLFLHETFLLVGIANISPVNIGDHRLTLPVDHLQTISVVWRGNDGTVKELLRSDSFEADHVIPTWEQTNGTPLVYMEMETPTGQIQIGPAPTVAGLIELLYVPLGTSLNAGNGEILVVPDEFMPAIKYGALIDLLSKDGRGQDTGRAEYCKQRWDLGTEAADLILKGWA